MRLTNHNAALPLARAGLPIFPACPETKCPLVRFTAAATRLERGVNYFWQRYPDAVPAINLSGAGLVVIDLDRGHGDGADGVAEFDKLLDQNGELPACPASRTPRGGVHLFFRQPDGAEPISNSAGQNGIGPGIDVRGFHGYVIAPGAVMADGTFYEAIAGTPDVAESFIAGTIPAIPAWLAELAERPPVVDMSSRAPRSLRVDSNRQPFGAAVLEGEAVALANAAIGTRNSILNKAAFVIASKAGALGWVSEGEAWAALWAACIANGYVADDGPKAFRRTFYSGWNDGVADPTPPRERLTADPAFAARIAKLKPRAA
jgi:Bifunctional DNA primase/polymerase, N-terminal